MSVEIQREVDFESIPADGTLQSAAVAALSDAESAEICIRIVDEAEGRALNHRWRGKDYATNVLAFPGSVPPGMPEATAPGVTGDIVLCAPVIAREAAEQGKPGAHHWAHLVVHGVLHLRGFDHIHAESASAMERTERVVLDSLGIPDPYAESC